MSKCDCYRLEPERHYFVDKYGAPIYENINVPRCWGRRRKIFAIATETDLSVVFTKAFGQKQPKKRRVFQQTKMFSKK